MRPVVSLSRPVAAWWLVLAAAVMLALRLQVVLSLPDGEADAYGHFGAARALVEDPANLKVHWVWLPGWHYVLWAMIHCGMSFQGVRIIVTLLQAFAPPLLYAFVAHRPGEPDPGRARLVAWIAALAWTIAPLSNVLATSAQAEPFFSILVLATALAIERSRFLVAGLLLAGACLIRYEAWGAVAALALWRLFKRDSVPLSTLVLPLCAIGAWVALRRYMDGEWFAFVWKTRNFVAQFRTTSGVGTAEEALSFLVRTPWRAIGPALLLLPLGIGRAVRPGWIVPAGIGGFLLVSHFGCGSLDIDRYLTCLVPFACVAIAEGALRVGELFPRLPRALPLGMVFAALLLTTQAQLSRFVADTVMREGKLQSMALKAGT